MQDVNTLKQQECTETPLFLFECRMPGGAMERWSTHAVIAGGERYEARVLGHNLFEVKSSLDDGADAAARIALTLANADSYFSQLEWNEGFKGAQLTVLFLFFDLRNGVPVTDARVVFRGVAGSPDEITETTLRVTFTNRLNLQRVLLPEVRIQRRCPWAFPGNAEQRRAAMTPDAGARYSPYVRCGYSAGESDGVGNLASDGKPFTACDFTRTQCEQRGMFDHDAAGHQTRRFGGVEFVPATVLVRSFGEKGVHASPVLDNQARYNDFVPLVYGTAWYEPPVVFARNDGNLTRFEVLLGAGEMSRVIKVVVNDVEIPEAVAGANMTGTGWFAVVSYGSRNGAFNADFTDASGQSLGDPYGSMAYLSVVVPNRVNNGGSVPRIQVLAEGLKLQRFDASGAALGAEFTDNPAWVLLDVLRRSGWASSDLDVASFARAAAYCEEPVDAKDLYGNAVKVPRYGCNLVVRRRRSAADLVRGIRNGSGLMLTMSAAGLMGVRAEGSLAVQQADANAGSNSSDKLNGGWPAFEFSDASAPFSGILRKASGEPWIRFFSRSAAETPNRLSVEFQDEFNEYQQDSLSLVDVDDATLIGQEVSANAAALGLPNFDQAGRVLQLQLDKSVRGNLYVEFATSVRGFGLAPGDVIAITYEKEGLVRQPFRIVKVAPSLNYATVVITAQYHDDGWYDGTGGRHSGGRRQPAFGVGIPRPLLGAIVDQDGNPQYKVTETARQSTDGSYSVGLSVEFAAPAKTQGPGIPALSLTPAIHSDGGSLKGLQTLYYAISGVDEHGAEGRLSFTVRAVLPPGGETFSVELRKLSFDAGTVGFRVYRGHTPSQLVRIASVDGVSVQFIDTGSAVDAVQGPPDDNYDHANFYWRLELQTESAVSISSVNTVGCDSLHMMANELRGAVVRVTSGQGAGQERSVLSNDATALTVSPRWDIVPDSTSHFVVAESSWRFGSLTVTGPAEFDIPNRKGAIVHVMGRAANVHDQECAAELSILTRWKIGAAGVVAVDDDVPPAPKFGLVPVGHGSIELAGIGFDDLKNTRTVTAGTLTVLYWSELGPAPRLFLASGISAEDTTLPVPVGAVQQGDVIQVDSEVMIVRSTDAAGATMERTAFGSDPDVHVAGRPIYLLTRRSYVVPFAKDFFGSPASGSFSFPISLPDVRIAAAELYLTNERGDGPPGRKSFMDVEGDGIRTLSGGQFSLQFDGTLALQNDATPPVMVEDSHAVRDVYAVLREPAAGPVRVRVRQDDSTYCVLDVAAGKTTASVDGFALGPVRSTSQLSLDVIGVPQDPALFPGADLTVTLRM